MNQHYKNALAGLAQTDIEKRAGLQTGEVTAIGTIQIQAALAVAAETAELRKAQNLGNLIAYAQLCNARRDGAKAMKANRAADRAMASVLGIQDDDEDDL